MTQGLQFSSLFSGLDLPLAADNAGLVADSPSQTEGTQAAAFRQLLADEQQSTAVSKGQTIAASGVSIQKYSKESAIDMTSVPKTPVLAEPSAEIVKIKEIEFFEELPIATEALADQWLGLIRQSGDATTLLRQKAELNTVFAMDLTKSVTAIETADNVVSLLLDTEFTESLSAGLETSTEDAQILDTNLLLNQAAQDATQITASSRPTSSLLMPPSNHNTVSQVLMHNTTANEPSFTLTQGDQQTTRLAEQVITPLLQEQKGTEKPVTHRNSKVNLPDLANPTVQKLLPEVAVEAVESTQDMTLLSNEISKDSEALALNRQYSKAHTVLKETQPNSVPLKLQDDKASGMPNQIQASALSLKQHDTKANVKFDEIQASALSLKPKDDMASGILNAIQTSTLDTSLQENRANSTVHEIQNSSLAIAPQDKKAPATHNENNNRAEKVVVSSVPQDSQLTDTLLTSNKDSTVESLELSELTLVSANDIRNNDLKLANSVEQTSIEANSQSQIVKQTEQVMPANPRELADVAESSVLVTNNVQSNSQPKTALSTSEFAMSESDKLRVTTVIGDNKQQDSSSDQQNQQRQDNRQYHFQRLDVLLQQNNSPSMQQSGVPNPIATRMAAHENALEVTQALVRNEQFTGVAEQQNRSQSSTAAPPSLAAQLKQINLQQQDAAGQLRERVQLMVRQNIQVAEIRLDPAELGLMQIKINLQQEQASVQFIVQQQHAKELLEQQMPRLRELLQQQGMQLGEGQVQQQNRDDRQAAGQQSGNSKQQQGASADLDDNPQAISVQIKQSERLVDYYA